MEKKKAKEKKDYDVRIECLVPTTITYRVTAESEQEALKEADKYYARRVDMKQHHHRKIKMKAIVLKPGSSMITLTKTYRVFS